MLSSAVGNRRSFRMQRNGLLGDFEVGEFPAGLAGLVGDFVEGGDLGFAEEKTGVLGGAGSGGGFDLAGQHAGVVAVAEDVGDDGFDVLLLVAAFGEGAGVHRVGVPDLKEEGAGAFVVADLIPTVAQGGERAADEGADDLVHEREAVALVRAERNQVFRLRRVGGGLAVDVDGGVRRELFAFAEELLDAAHGDDGSGPIDDDGIADGVGGGEAPRVGIGAEGRKFPAEGDDFREGSGAIRVGDVAALGGVHHVAATPEVVEGVVDGDHTDAVFIGEFDGFLDGGVAGGLAEFFIGVPDGGTAETSFYFFDLGFRHAAVGAGAEDVIEVEGLEGIVGADAVARGVGAKARAGFGFGL